MSTFTAFFSQTADRMARDERGTIAIITGLIFIVLCGGVAMAMDGARGYTVAHRAASALDSALLATGRRLAKEGSNFNAQTFAQGYFDNQMQTMQSGTEAETYNPIVLNVDTNAGTVSASVTATVPTTFGALLGVDQLTVSKSATVAYGNQDLELALMIDVTGSMNWSAGGGLTKLEALKASVGNLTNILMKDPNAGGGRVRVAVAPYSTSVNAGTYAAAVSNNTSNDNCVVERLTNPNNDNAPSVSIDALRSIEVANSELQSGSYGRYRCPAAEVVALTDSKSEVVNAVNSYSASGGTAAHLGIAWAWYLISDKWNGIFGKNAAPKGDTATIKAVILMTDGEYNTAYQGVTGQDLVNPYNTAAQLCQNMKADGIRIFSVGFQLPSVTAADSLRDCASLDEAGNKQFYQPSTPDELNAVYASIATKLSSLRISE